MRKVLSLTLAASMMIVAMTGCLKDKGFENDEFGITIPEVKGVSFTQASSSPVVVGLNASATPLTVDGPLLALNQNGMATSPVTITVAINNTLVTDAGKTLLPAGSYTTSPLTVTIPAGERISDAIKITFANSGILDPNLEYGIGFTITSVDGNYKIASNQKDVLFVFTVKNKYDGNYSLRIKTIGWAAFGISENQPGTWPSIAGGYSIGMVTGGPNTVRHYDYWGFDDFIQVAFTTNNAQGTGFGATAPRFHFDLTTDKLINVTNDLPDDGRGRVFLLNPAVTDSRYDPVTKKIYAAYLLKNNGRPDLQIFDTLTYVGPRP